jgi:ubiquinone/menaquinone biosynthesis C-methylase UbiE
MSTTQTHQHQPGAIVDGITALSMTVGRGHAARLAVDLAQIGAGDRVVDVACGPGTAVRVASRRGAHATGVDPSAAMLRLGCLITKLERMTGPTFIEGAAGALPLPDRSADVVWALSSVHHWADPARWLTEARRVLNPGGRLLIAEPSVRPGARGHAAHGLTTEGTDELEQAMKDVGFVEIERQIRKAGRRTLVVITATSPSPTRTEEQR